MRHDASSSKLPTSEGTVNSGNSMHQSSGHVHTRWRNVNHVHVDPTHIQDIATSTS